MATQAHHTSTSAVKEEQKLDHNTDWHGPSDHNDTEHLNGHKDEERQYNESQLQLAWGKYGKLILWIGAFVMWTVFEFDNATVYNYQNIATSEFQSISNLGALSTAGTIVSAVIKPPVARLSDVIGRAEAYAVTVLFYIIAYAMTASAKSFSTYSGGYIIYCVGQSGMQILNQIIVADITSSKWRALANQVISLPFLYVPWIAAFIVDSALASVGWRWGIGIFAIVLPICSLSIIVPIKYYQHRTRKLVSNSRKPPGRLSLSIFSDIDMGGIILLSGGFALLLLPLALAGTTPEKWNTPWVPALLAVGAVLLIALVFYEWKVAKNPILPPRYLKNISIVLACLIGLLDAFAFSVTHTYMYPWATVVHLFTVREATFLTFTAGCMQIVSGVITGWIMLLTKRYKYILVVGLVIRLIGYGVMIRLRGTDNSMAELFVVQIIQGTGSGVVQTIVLVVAQIVVSHAELAPATALVLLFIYLGNAIGSAVAGSIYTNEFAMLLRRYLPGGGSVDDNVINALINTLETDVVSDGIEKTAVNLAYSEVMRYMTYAALAAAAIPFFMVLFLPNLRLSNKHNIHDEISLTTLRQEDNDKDGGFEVGRRFSKFTNSSKD